MYIYMYIYICIYIYVCICIYIYIYIYRKLGNKKQNQRKNISDNLIKNVNLSSSESFGPSKFWISPKLYELYKCYCRNPA